MKVKQLIEVLQSQDADAEVCIAQPTHDHWRSTVVERITDVAERCVKFSAYHDARVIDDEGTEWVVVIQ